MEFIDFMENPSNLIEGASDYDFILTDEVFMDV